MGKQEIRRRDVIEALEKIALSRPNAAIELAYREKPSQQAIRRLDLSAVSEFKRNSAGSVEIRFIDRIKALETLCNLLDGESGSEEADAFFRALEQAGEEADAWQG